MSIIRPADGEGGAEGHSGRQFKNPKHAEMLEAVRNAAPHLRP